MSGLRRAMISIGSMLAACLWMGTAGAQSVPFEEVHTLSRGPEPVVRTFDIAAAGTYRLTLTDLAVPAAFTSLEAAITRGDTVVATLTEPGSVDFSASEAASYTLRVVGVPATAAGAGSFGASVVNTTAGNTVTLEFAEAINNPPPVVPPNRRTLDTTFEVTEAGEHEVALIDHAFPAALPTLTLAVLRDGDPALAAQLAAPGTATFVATPGRYRLLVIGESTTATNAGAFGVRIRTAASQTLVYSRSEPVGRVKDLVLPPLEAGAHQLTLSDLAFPVPLATNAALITAGADAAARRNVPGTVAFTAVAGEHQLLVLAVASASLPGSYGIELRRDPNTRVFSTVLTAPAANASATGVQAFNYVVEIPTAGAYRLRLADFQFPQAFVSSGIAATQSGTLLGSLDEPGTLTLNVVEAGNLFVVALAQPAVSATPSGLLGMDIVSTTAGATPIFERTEGVGALFAARSISIAAAGQYEATITDLRFPAQFDELAAVVTRGAERLGSVFAGGTFPFAAQPGSYIVSVIARPSQSAVYGTYGLRVSARPPAPVLAMSADATSVPNGGTAMLTWTTTNATACTASGGWTGTRATSGSERTAAITASTTFTLNCDGPGGQGSASVSLTPTSAGGSGGSRGGGGGRIDVLLLALLAALLIAARSQRRASRTANVFGVLLAAGLFMPADSAWAAEKVAAAAVLPASTGQTIDDRAYRIQPGDVLVVAVWKERDLQGDILVRPDGGISFPLAGDIAAGGNTVVQLGDALAAKLKRYIPDPVVTVAVKSIGGNRVYVLGKVNRPGEFAFSQPLDVMQALALAGGATPFAAVNDIRILRRNDNRLVAVEFQYAEVERGRRLEQNIVLRSGDTVVVP
jgi:polysaccharide biosynthesis/export protein